MTPPSHAFHIAGLLISAAPGRVADVARDLAAVPGLHVHAGDNRTGRIVVTLETASIEEQEAEFARVRTLREVRAVERLRRARLAETVGARLVLAHVVPRVSAPASWSSRAETAVECRETDAHRHMCRVMAPLEKHGPVESVIVEGNIAERVAELVRSSHAGLIVMGLDREARGSRPGSTAYAVICSAAVPVLAMPAAVADGDAGARVDRATAREDKDASAHMIA